jgi:hypothetical protein
MPAFPAPPISGNDSTLTGPGQGTAWIRPVCPCAVGPSFLDAGPILRDAAISQWQRRSRSGIGA